MHLAPDMEVGRYHMPRQRDYNPVTHPVRRRSICAQDAERLFLSRLPPAGTGNAETEPDRAPGPAAAQQGDEEMTRREAVRRTVRCEPVWPPPYNLDFTRPMRARLAEHFGTDDVDAAVGNYILQINVGSNAGAEVNRVAAGLMRPAGPGLFLDEFGVVWDKSAGDDIGIPVNRVLTKPDPSALVMPDPDDPERWKGYEELKASAGDRYLLACFSSPLFQRAWFLRGMAELLADMAAEPEPVGAFFDRLADFTIGIVRGVAARGADGMFFYDDYAQQSGLLFSPAMFRHFLAPRLARIFREVRRAGMDVFFHCCGDCTLILEDLRSAGVQVFNPFQPEVMDVAAVAEQFRGRMAFYGGISTQKTLPFGTPEDVRREAARMRSLFRESGGYIAAPAHAIQRDVPLENVLALIESVRD
ncbi:MAG: uroporphyrinogen decarboxylase family protein [Planctomycetota bacterium]|nr:uroporphyrinogen decarboxylase family protein [Planctomycetota bacterium]